MLIEDRTRPGADSGELRVRIGPCGFIEEVILGETRLVGAPADGERRVIFDVLVPDGKLDRPGDAHRAGRAVRSAARPSECQCTAAEEEGTARLKARGRLAAASFSTSLTLVRDSSLVTAEYAVTPSGGKDELVNRCGVSFRVMLDANKKVRRTGFWTGDRIEDWAYGERHHAGDPPDRQIGPDTKAWPFWRVGGCFRDGYGHFRIWKTTGWNMGPMTMAEGEGGGEWGYITDGKVFCAFGVAAGRWSGAFSFRVSNDSGEVAFYTHPPEARPCEPGPVPVKLLLLFGKGDPLKERSLAEPLLAAMKGEGR